MGTLIAEDLLLLLLDDELGTLSTWTYPQPALGGAVLIELAITGAVRVEDKRRAWHSSKVRVTGVEPEDVVLRAGYDLVAEKERGAQDLVNRIGKDLQPRLSERLVARGLLEKQESKVLGLFSRTRWPAADSRHEEEVRRGLTAALVQGLDPDERTGALIALLSALDKAHKVVDHDGLPARQVRKRAKDIAAGAWAATAVRDAIAASTAAVTAAVAVTTTVATSGSS